MSKHSDHRATSHSFLIRCFNNPEEKHSTIVLNVGFFYCPKTEIFIKNIETIFSEAFWKPFQIKSI